MFYYKSFTPLCNCFLFPCSHFKHLKIYHLIFSIGIISLTFFFLLDYLNLFYWLHHAAPAPLSAPSCSSPRSPCHHTGQAYLLRRYPCFAPTTLSPPSRLRNVLRSSAHTVSLRFAPGALLRKHSFAALAPLPLLPPSLPIYIFSKFSFPCVSTGRLKSAFIIEGFPILEEQVSPA